MKPEKALKQIKILQDSIGSFANEDVFMALSEARHALEKQIGEKPLLDIDDYVTRYCPNCGSDGIYEEDEYCSLCGQKIEWSEDNDGSPNN